MATTETRGPRQILQALGWSANGLRASWRHEASFRLEVWLSAFLLPLGFWLGQEGVQRAVLCGSVLLVLAAELLNSAIEAVVDLVSPNFNELAGRAKDMGSAAVLVLLINVALCWMLVLYPVFAAGE